jgi:tRNA threonylcarbamoyladenosine biosynthesis protein TsaE
MKLKKIFFRSEISCDQVPNIANDIISNIPNNSILLLEGSVGSGKTTLVTEFCKVFNMTSSQSPTFSIHHRYSSEFIIIDHFDLYRIKSEEELDSVGFWDLIQITSNYKIIEWPEICIGGLLGGNSDIFLLKIANNLDKRSYSFFKLI